MVCSWRTRRGTTRADVRRARPACHPRATPGSWHLIGNLSPWRSRVSRCTCLASIHTFKLHTPRRLERVFTGTARLPSECHPQKSAHQPSAACLLIQDQRSDATKCLHRRARPWRQAFACSGAASESGSVFAATQTVIPREAEARSVLCLRRLATDEKARTLPNSKLLLNTTEAAHTRLASSGSGCTNAVCVCSFH